MFDWIYPANLLTTEFRREVPLPSKLQYHDIKLEFQHQKAPTASVPHVSQSLVHIPKVKSKKSSKNRSRYGAFIIEQLHGDAEEDNSRKQWKTYSSSSSDSERKPFGERLRTITQQLAEDKDSQKEDQSHGSRNVYCEENNVESPGSESEKEYEKYRQKFLKTFKKESKDSSSARKIKEEIPRKKEKRSKKHEKEKRNIKSSSSPAKRCVNQLLSLAGNQSPSLARNQSISLAGILSGATTSESVDGKSNIFDTFKHQMHSAVVSEAHSLKTSLSHSRKYMDKDSAYRANSHSKDKNNSDTIKIKTSLIKEFKNTDSIRRNDSRSDSGTSSDSDTVKSKTSFTMTRKQGDKDGVRQTDGHREQKASSKSSQSEQKSSSHSCHSEHKANTGQSEDKTSSHTGQSEDKIRSLDLSQSEHKTSSHSVQNEHKTSSHSVHSKHKTSSHAGQSEHKTSSHSVQSEHKTSSHSVHSKHKTSSHSGQSEHKTSSHSVQSEHKTSPHFGHSEHITSSHSCDCEHKINLHSEKAELERMHEQSPITKKKHEKQSHTREALPTSRKSTVRDGANYKLSSQKTDSEKVFSSLEIGVSKRQVKQLGRIPKKIKHSGDTDCPTAPKKPIIDRDSVGVADFDKEFKQLGQKDIKTKHSDKSAHVKEWKKSLLEFNKDLLGVNAGSKENLAVSSMTSNTDSNPASSVVDRLDESSKSLKSFPAVSVSMNTVCRSKHAASRRDLKPVGKELLVSALEGRKNNTVGLSSELERLVCKICSPVQVKLTRIDCAQILNSKEDSVNTGKHNDKTDRNDIKVAYDSRIKCKMDKNSYKMQQVIEKKTDEKPHMTEEESDIKPHMTEKGSTDITEIAEGDVGDDFDNRIGLSNIMLSERGDDFDVIDRLSNRESVERNILEAVKGREAYSPSVKSRGPNTWLSSVLSQSKGDVIPGLGDLDEIEKDRRMPKTEQKCSRTVRMTRTGIKVCVCDVGVNGSQDNKNKGIEDLVKASLHSSGFGGHLMPERDPLVHQVVGFVLHQPSIVKLRRKITKLQGGCKNSGYLIQILQSTSSNENLNLANEKPKVDKVTSEQLNIISMKAVQPPSMSQVIRGWENDMEATEKYIVNVDSNQTIKIVNDDEKSRSKALEGKAYQDTMTVSEKSEECVKIIIETKKATEIEGMQEAEPLVACSGKKKGAAVPVVKQKKENIESRPENYVPKEVSIKCEINPDQLKTVDVGKLGGKEILKETSMPVVKNERSNEQASVESPTKPKTPIWKSEDGISKLTEDGNIDICEVTVEIELTVGSSKNTSSGSAIENAIQKEKVKSSATEDNEKTLHPEKLNSENCRSLDGIENVLSRTQPATLSKDKTRQVSGHSREGSVERHRHQSGSADKGSRLSSPLVFSLADKSSRNQSSTSGQPLETDKSLSVRKRLEHLAAKSMTSEETRAEKRQARQYHPYRKDNRPAAKDTPLWSFDIAYRDMNELLQNLTENQFMKQGQKQADVSEWRKSSGRRTNWRSASSARGRFAGFKFARAPVPRHLPSNLSTSDEDEPEEAVRPEAIPNLEERGRQADLVEQIFMDGADSEELENFSTEKCIYNAEQVKEEPERAVSVCSVREEKKQKPISLISPEGLGTTTFSGISLDKTNESSIELACESGSRETADALETDDIPDADGSIYQLTQSYKQEINYNDNSPTRKKEDRYMRKCENKDLDKIEVKSTTTVKRELKISDIESAEDIQKDDGNGNTYELTKEARDKAEDISVYSDEGEKLFSKPVNVDSAVPVIAYVQDDQDESRGTEADADNNLMLPFEQLAKNENLITLSEDDHRLKGVNKEHISTSDNIVCEREECDEAALSHHSFPSEEYVSKTDKTSENLNCVDIGNYLELEKGCTNKLVDKRNEKSTCESNHDVRRDTENCSGIKVDEENNVTCPKDDRKPEIAESEPQSSGKDQASETATTTVCAEESANKQETLQTKRPIFSSESDECLDWIDEDTALDKESLSFNEDTVLDKHSASFNIEDASEECVEVEVCGEENYIILDSCGETDAEISIQCCLVDDYHSSEDDHVDNTTKETNALGPLSDNEKVVEDAKADFDKDCSEVKKGFETTSVSHGQFGQSIKTVNSKALEDVNVKKWEKDRALAVLTECTESTKQETLETDEEENGHACYIITDKLDKEEESSGFNVQRETAHPSIVSYVEARAEELVEATEFLDIDPEEKCSIPSGNIGRTYEIYGDIDDDSESNDIDSPEEASIEQELFAPTGMSTVSDINSLLPSFGKTAEHKELTAKCEAEKEVDNGGESWAETESLKNDASENSILKFEKNKEQQNFPSSSSTSDLAITAPDEPKEKINKELTENNMPSKVYKSHDKFNTEQRSQLDDEKNNSPRSSQDICFHKPQNTAEQELLKKCKDSPVVHVSVDTITDSIPVIYNTELINPEHDKTVQTKLEVKVGLGENIVSKGDELQKSHNEKHPLDSEDKTITCSLSEEASKGSLDDRPKIFFLNKTPNSSDLSRASDTQISYKSSACRKLNTSSSCSLFGQDVPVLTVSSTSNAAALALSSCPGTTNLISSDRHHIYCLDESKPSHHHRASHVASQCTRALISTVSMTCSQSGSQATPQCTRTFKPIAVPSTSMGSDNLESLCYKTLNLHSKRQAASQHQVEYQCVSRSNPQSINRTVSQRQQEVHLVSRSNLKSVCPASSQIRQVLNPVVCRPSHRLQSISLVKSQGPQVLNPTVSRSSHLQSSPAASQGPQMLNPTVSRSSHLQSISPGASQSPQLLNHAVSMTSHLQSISPAALQGPPMLNLTVSRSSHLQSVSPETSQGPQVLESSISRSSHIQQDSPLAVKCLQTFSPRGSLSPYPQSVSTPVSHCQQFLQPVAGSCPWSVSPVMQPSQYIFSPSLSGPSPRFPQGYHYQNNSIQIPHLWYGQNFSSFTGHPPYNRMTPPSYGLPQQRFPMQGQWPMRSHGFYNSPPASQLQQNSPVLNSPMLNSPVLNPHLSPVDSSFDSTYSASYFSYSAVLSSQNTMPVYFPIIKSTHPASKTHIADFSGSADEDLKGSIDETELDNSKRKRPSVLHKTRPSLLKRPRNIGEHSKHVASSATAMVNEELLSELGSRPVGTKSENSELVTSIAEAVSTNIDRNYLAIKETSIGYSIAGNTMNCEEYAIPGTNMASKHHQTFQPKKNVSCGMYQKSSGKLQLLETHSPPNWGQRDKTSIRFCHSPTISDLVKSFDDKKSSKNTVLESKVSEIPLPVNENLCESVSRERVSIEMTTKDNEFTEQVQESKVTEDTGKTWKDLEDLFDLETDFEKGKHEDESDCPSSSDNKKSECTGSNMHSGIEKSINFSKCNKREEGSKNECSEEVERFYKETTETACDTKCKVGYDHQKPDYKIIDYPKEELLENRMNRNFMGKCDAVNPEENDGSPSPEQNLSADNENELLDHSMSKKEGSIGYRCRDNPEKKEVVHTKSEENITVNHRFCTEIMIDIAEDWSQSNSEIPENVPNSSQQIELADTEQTTETNLKMLQSVKRNPITTPEQRICKKNCKLFEKEVNTLSGISNKIDKQQRTSHNTSSDIIQSGIDYELEGTSACRKLERESRSIVSAPVLDKEEQLSETSFNLSTEMALFYKEISKLEAEEEKSKHQSKTKIISNVVDKESAIKDFKEEADGTRPSNSAEISKPFCSEITGLKQQVHETEDIKKEFADDNTRLKYWTNHKMNPANVQKGVPVEISGSGESKALEEENNKQEPDPVSSIEEQSQDVNSHFDGELETFYKEFAEIESEEEIVKEQAWPRLDNNLAADVCDNLKDQESSTDFGKQKRSIEDKHTPSRNQCYVSNCELVEKSCKEKANGANNLNEDGQRNINDTSKTVDKSDISSLSLICTLYQNEDSTSCDSVDTMEQSVVSFKGLIQKETERDTDTSAGCDKRDVGKSNINASIEKIFQNCKWSSSIDVIEVNASNYQDEDFLSEKETPDSSSEKMMHDNNELRKGSNDESVSNDWASEHETDTFVMSCPAEGNGSIERNDYKTKKPESSKSKAMAKEKVELRPNPSLSDLLSKGIVCYQMTGLQNDQLTHPDTTETNLDRQAISVDGRTMQQWTKRGSQRTRSSLDYPAFASCRFQHREGWKDSPDSNTKLQYTKMWLNSSLAKETNEAEHDTSYSSVYDVLAYFEHKHRSDKSSYTYHRRWGPRSTGRLRSRSRESSDFNRIRHGSSQSYSNEQRSKSPESSETDTSRHASDHSHRLGHSRWHRSRLKTWYTRGNSSFSKVRESESDNSKSSRTRSRTRTYRFGSSESSEADVSSQRLGRYSSRHRSRSNEAFTGTDRPRSLESHRRGRSRARSAVSLEADKIVCRSRYRSGSNKSSETIKSGSCEPYMRRHRSWSSESTKTDRSKQRSGYHSRFRSRSEYMCTRKYSSSSRDLLETDRSWHRSRFRRSCKQRNRSHLVSSESLEYSRRRHSSRSYSTSVERIRPGSNSSFTRRYRSGSSDSSDAYRRNGSKSDIIVDRSKSRSVKDSEMYNTRHGSRSSSSHREDVYTKHRLRSDNYSNLQSNRNSSRSNKSSDVYQIICTQGSDVSCTRRSRYRSRSNCSANVYHGRCSHKPDFSNTYRSRHSSRSSGSSDVYQRSSSQGSDFSETTRRRHTSRLNDSSDTERYDSVHRGFYASRRERSRSKDSTGSNDLSFSRSRSLDLSNFNRRNVRSVSSDSQVVEGRLSRSRSSTSSSDLRRDRSMSDNSDDNGKQRSRSSDVSMENSKIDRSDSNGPSRAFFKRISFKHRQYRVKNKDGGDIDKNRFGPNDSTDTLRSSLESEVHSGVRDCLHVSSPTNQSNFEKSDQSESSSQIVEMSEREITEYEVSRQKANHSCVRDSTTNNRSSVSRPENIEESFMNYTYKINDRNKETTKMNSDYSMKHNRNMEAGTTKRFVEYVGVEMCHTKPIACYQGLEKRERKNENEFFLGEDLGRNPIMEEIREAAERTQNIKKSSTNLLRKDSRDRDLVVPERDQTVKKVYLQPSVLFNITPAELTELLDELKQISGARCTWKLVLTCSQMFQLAVMYWDPKGQILQSSQYGSVVEIVDDQGLTNCEDRALHELRHNTSTRNVFMIEDTDKKCDSQSSSLGLKKCTLTNFMTDFLKPM